VGKGQGDAGELEKWRKRLRHWERVVCF